MPTKPPWRSASRFNQSSPISRKRKTPKDESGKRQFRFHKWLTDDVGNPMLDQHLTSIITLQRLAIAHGHGWRRFLQTVDQVLPRVGDTMVLPLGLDESEDDETPFVPPTSAAAHVGAESRFTFVVSTTRHRKARVMQALAPWCDAGDHGTP